MQCWLLKTVHALVFGWIDFSNWWQDLLKCFVVFKEICNILYWEYFVVIYYEVLLDFLFYLYNGELIIEHVLNVCDFMFAVLSIKIWHKYSGGWIASGTLRLLLQKLLHQKRHQMPRKLVTVFCMITRLTWRKGFLEVVHRRDGKSGKICKSLVIRKQLWSRPMKVQLFRHQMLVQVQRLKCLKRWCWVPRLWHRWNGVWRHLYCLWKIING